MIDGEKLEMAAKRLRVYDVEQGAWEHEREGYVVNTRHVLYHLVKDATAKDFTDPETVKSAIAPDSMQYAIRLGRWNGLLLSSIQEANEAWRLEGRFGSLPAHQIAVIGASSALAANLHGLDHENHQTAAWLDKKETSRRAAGLLLHSVQLQSDEYGFDMFEAFDTRLAVLREHFGIPEPTEVQ